MDSKKCRGCREEVPKEAKKCKHCQIDLRNWFLRHKIITGFLILFVIGAIGQGIKNSKEEVKNTSVDSTVVAEVEPVIIEITAKQLYSEYERNEVLADEGYKNMTLKVTGTIRDIGKDFLDDMYLTFETSNYFSSVRCYLENSEKDKVIKLNKGQLVTVQGKGTGLVVGDVVISDCAIK